MLLPDSELASKLAMVAFSDAQKACDAVPVGTDGFAFIVTVTAKRDVLTQPVVLSFDSA